ncbi:MAG: glycosyltransferase [Niabella sp.]
MGKIKILQAIRQGSIGGGESHVLDLVAGLDKNRFDPVVLSFTPGPMVDSLREQGIKTYVIETQRPFNVFVWPKVKQVMVNEGIQLLHAHGTRACSNTFQPAKKLNIPIIYTVHGWSFHNDQSPFVKRLRIKSEEYLVKQSSRTICVSDSNYKEGDDLFGISSKAIVIKNGINQARFRLENKFADVRKELGIGVDVTLVGFIARVTAQKNPLGLIEAMSKIPPTYNIKLLMVGDGDLKEEAQKLASDLGLQDRIIFQPFRKDVPDLLNAIDIYCLPSLWEGLSIALLEAMAMRKAIVATPVDGTREVIVDKHNGILVPEKDSQGLANAFMLLTSDASLRETIARRAFETISEQFNTSDMVSRIEQFYETLI